MGVPILSLLLALVLAVLIVRVIDWRIGYSRFLDRNLRTRVGAALIVHNNRILLRFLPAGPFKQFWFLPSAYLHKKAGDHTTRKTAVRKVLDINENLKFEQATKVTGRGGKLSKLDTISYALQLGLVPTVIDIYEFTITNPEIISEGDKTKWCGQDDISESQGPIHPLVPEILNLYFGTPALDSVEKVEEQSKRVFEKQPLRAKRIKPEDELPPEQVIDKTDGAIA